MNPAIKKVVVASVLGIAAIAGYEGLENKAYVDPVGVTTICYGHTATAKLGQKKTSEECWKLLEKDAKIASDTVLRYTKVPLSQDELDAYTSFVYNLGAGNFASSTLLRKLNAGDRVGACNELKRWVYGKVKGVNTALKGLVNRRNAENVVCLRGARSHE